MPKLYEYLGIIFQFYSNDHKPIHIHAISGEFRSKIEFIYLNGKLKEILIKTVRGYKPLPPATLKDAMTKAKESEIAKKMV
jgi:hypothetical protein